MRVFSKAVLRSARPVFVFFFFSLFLSRIDLLVTERNFDIATIDLVARLKGDRLDAAPIVGARDTEGKCRERGNCRGKPGA